MSVQQSESLLGGEDGATTFHDPYPEDSEATLAVDQQTSHHPATFPDPGPSHPLFALHPWRAGPQDRRMKAREFNGDGSWRNYRSHFDRVADLNHWGREMKLQFLWVHLCGVALSYVEELPDEKKQTYEDVCHAMDQRFGAERMATIFKAELKHKVRKAGESLPALGQEIRRLARLAYPDFASTAIEEIAREKFVESLTDSTLRLRLHHADTPTLEAAIEFALHHEAWTTAEADRSPPMGRARGTA